MVAVAQDHKAARIALHKQARTQPKPVERLNEGVGLRCSLQPAAIRNAAGPPPRPPLRLRGRRSPKCTTLSPQTDAISAAAIRIQISIAMFSKQL